LGWLGRFGLGLIISRVIKTLTKKGKGWFLSGIGSRDFPFGEVGYQPFP